MTFTPQETEFLISLLRQVNVNAANPQAQQTIALTQSLLTKLAASDTAKAGPEGLHSARTLKADRSA